MPKHKLFLCSKLARYALVLAVLSHCALPLVAQNKKSTIAADTTKTTTSSPSRSSKLNSYAGQDAIVADADELVVSAGPGGFQSALTTWLKANVGITTATDGSNVTLWQDQALGGHDAQTSLFGEANPIYRNTNSTINFNPTVDFGSASGSALRIADNSDFNTNNSFFERKGINIAFRTGGNTTSKQVVYEQGGNGRGLNIYIQDGSLFYSAWNLNNDGFGAPWGFDFVSTSISADTEYILSFEYDGDDDLTDDLSGVIRCYLNGQLVGSITNVGLLYNHGNDIGIGDEVNNTLFSNGMGGTETVQPTNSFDGEISEFIYCNEPASFPLASRNKIESYLAIKYGITLDQSSPYNYVNSNGDVIFNTTDAASLGGYLEYNNDITGIGRDDDAELTQLKSKSENSGSIVTIERAISIDNDDNWLIWGNDASSTAKTALLTMPNTIAMRLTRVWRVAEENEIGVTAVSFDLTELGLSTNNVSDYTLLVAGNSTNADFSSATVLTGGTINSGVITFTGVDLEDGEYFTLGTDFPICSPGGVSAGLLLSLKADAGTTGTSNVTAWADQSFSNFSAAATIGPELISNGINYNPSLQFNGTNETMAITNGILGTSTPNDLVVFAVTEVATVQNSWLFYEALASSGRFSSHLPWGTSTAYYDYPNATPASGRVSGAWGGTTGNANLWTLFSSTSSFTTASGNINKGIFRDGSLIASNTSSITGTGNNSNFNIASDGTNFYDADIAEILIYSTAPTTQELEQIQTYLAIKYGIFKNSPDIGSTGSVDERDYFRSDATVIWDQSVNSAYHQDVAGIGRDDASCLNQKQSASEATDDIVAIGLGSITTDNASNVNSFTSDGDFMVWGNDGGATAQAGANTSDVPGIVTERMTRIWRVDETGTVGNTEIQFDLTGLGYSSTASDFQLIISGTSTMADGNTFAGGTFNGNLLSFSGIDLTDGQYFTLATALETCGPGGVTTNLELWLRADAGTSTTVDGVDLTGATAWEDQSTNARHGGESNLGGGALVEPTYETEEINFNPVIRFTDPGNTNASYIETSPFSTPGEDLTLISVFKSDQNQGTSDDIVNTPALIGGNDNGSNRDYGLGFFGGAVVMNARSGNAFTASTASTYNDNQPHISLTTRERTSRSVEIFMEGQSAATGTGQNHNYNGAPSLGIGNHSDGNVNAQFDGDIAENMVFSRILTDEEQSRVESYLALKYGLTLSANRDGDGNLNELISGAINEGDYVAGDGDVIWDYADQGATYYNDIFGIGRDDISCFNQTRSKSESTDAIVTFNNPSAFSMDDSWLISGNDNAPIEAINNPERPASIKSRLNREWRIQETGTVSQIELTYDLSAVTGTPLGNNDLNLLKLMVDADGDFSTGVTLIDPSSIDLGAQTVTFLVDFSNGEYYTLGSLEVDALPITLISFDTKVTSDNKAKVFWTTAQEINNSFFTIERSRDAETFETVGFVEGAGNSDDIINYSFIDTEPLDGIAYYRLKQTDFNGDFEYSDVSRIKLDLTQSTVHQVVPNPVTMGDSFKVNYPVKTNQDVRIYVTNVNGVIAQSKIVSVTPEVGEIEMSTVGLSKGLYLIRIVDQHLNNITLKFIVR